VVVLVNRGTVAGGKRGNVRHWVGLIWGVGKRREKEGRGKAQEEEREIKTKKTKKEKKRKGGLWEQRKVPNAHSAPLPMAMEKGNSHCGFRGFFFFFVFSKSSKSLKWRSPQGTDSWCSFGTLPRVLMGNSRFHSFLFFSFLSFSFFFFPFLLRSMLFAALFSGTQVQRANLVCEPPVQHLPRFEEVGLFVFDCFCFSLCDVIFFLFGCSVRYTTDQKGTPGNQTSFLPQKISLSNESNCYSREKNETGYFITFVREFFGLFIYFFSLLPRTLAPSSGGTSCVDRYARSLVSALLEEQLFSLRHNRTIDSSSR
jgi:hypothetical protein